MGDSARGRSRDQEVNDTLSFFKLVYITVAAVLFSGSSMTPEKASPLTRTDQLRGIKNILVLFVDQQRFDCLGCYGNDTVKTPNLDRLAHHGIRESLPRRYE